MLGCDGGVEEVGIDGNEAKKIWMGKWQREN